jgi:hypothetical protein
MELFNESKRKLETRRKTDMGIDDSSHPCRSLEKLNSLTVSKGRNS